MSEEGKEAIKELKHYVNITPHWKLEEYTFSEVDNYIKTTLNYTERLEKEKEELQKEKEELKNKLKEIESIVDTRPYVAYTDYGDLLYESDEILEIIRGDESE